MDVSGCHPNNAHGFVCLRPAPFVAGKGEAHFRRFRRFRHRALP
jgi:hypothetical protein